MPTYEYMQRYYTEGGKLIIEEVMWNDPDAIKYFRFDWKGRHLKCARPKRERKPPAGGAEFYPRCLGVGCWVLGPRSGLGVGCWARPEAWVLGVGCWDQWREPRKTVKTQPVKPKNSSLRGILLPSTTASSATFPAATSSCRVAANGSSRGRARAHHGLAAVDDRDTRCRRSAAPPRAPAPLGSGTDGVAVLHEPQRRWSAVLRRYDADVPPCADGA